MKALQKNCKKLSKVDTHVHDVPTNTHIKCVGSPVTEKKFGTLIRISHMQKKNKQSVKLHTWFVNVEVFYDGNQLSNSHINPALYFYNCET